MASLAMESPPQPDRATAQPRTARSRYLGCGWDGGDDGITSGRVDRPASGPIRGGRCKLLSQCAFTGISSTRDQCAPFRSREKATICGWAVSISRFDSDIASRTTYPFKPRPLPRRVEPLEDRPNSADSSPHGHIPARRTEAPWPISSPCANQTWLQGFSPEALLARNAPIATHFAAQQSFAGCVDIAGDSESSVQIRSI
jgi:hypothetical protein